MKDFKEQIQKGSINVIDQNSLIIENYPYGFKTCKMTFCKYFNRNGQIIERISDLNGKICKDFIQKKNLKNYKK